MAFHHHDFLFLWHGAVKPKMAGRAEIVGLCACCHCDGRTQVSHRRHRHRQRTASITAAAKRTVDLYHTWLPTGTDAMVLSRGLVRKARVGIMDYLFSYRTCRLRHEQCTGTVGTEIEFVGVVLSVSSLVDLSLDLSPLAFVSGQ